LAEEQGGTRGGAIRRGDKKTQGVVGGAGRIRKVYQEDRKRRTGLSTEGKGRESGNREEGNIGEGSAWERGQNKTPWKEVREWRISKGLSWEKGVRKSGGK